VSEDVVTIELDAREHRLYDRLRVQLVPGAPGANSGVRDVLLLLPDLTVLAARLMRDPRVPRGSKLLAMIGVGYVLSPLDLIPALIFGPIGWIDDAIVVTAALSRMLNHVHPDIVRSHWSGRGDALEAIQRVTSWSESLLGGRLRGFVRGAWAAAPRRSP
jgi:uncharacterized membrane protein YkvA (DUF1232 family)